jgi:hypothetical protein
MVFHVKNAHAHKKIVSKMVISLLLLSTLMFLLVQLPPVSAQAETASLTGIIYDEGVDSDGDGAFDQLSLGVEINVTTAGTYRVEAGGLYDTADPYNSVTVLTNGSAYLDTGIQVIYVQLGGTEVYAKQANPNTIAGIILYDSSDNLLDDIYDVTLSRQYSYSEFQQPDITIELDEVKRDITLDQMGSIYVTNSYRITPVGFWTGTVELGFPEGAYDFELRDEMGTLETATANNVLTVTLRDTVDENETETLYVNYHIPWSDHVTQQNGVDYGLQFTFYEQFDSTIGKLTVSVTLPEGAELQSSTPTADNTEKSELQETLTFAFTDVTPSQNLAFNVNYKYLVFWGSFYPTIWIGLIAAVAAVILFLWGTPKTITAPTIQVPLKDIKGFVDACEEKTRIKSDLEALEERLKKGKIPRRRYKVRKKMLDGRLSTVCRNLVSLREQIRAAGSRYAKMMREIEVAEANLESAERDLRRVESRYRRGEISKGAYGKLLDEYNRRIEEAEATIDGVLLRLRE